MTLARSLLALALAALLLAPARAETDDTQVRQHVFDGMRLRMEQKFPEAATSFATALDRFDLLRQADPEFEGIILRGLFGSAVSAERWRDAVRAGGRLRRLEGYGRGVASPEALEMLDSLARAHEGAGEHPAAVRLHEEAIETVMAATDADEALRLLVLTRAREAMAAAEDWARAEAFGLRHLGYLRARKTPAVVIAHFLQSLSREVLAPAGRLHDALAMARESEGMLRECDAAGDMSCAVALVTTEELLLRLLQDADLDREVDALVARIKERGGDAVGLVVVSTDPPGARVYNLLYRAKKPVRGAFLGTTRRPLKITQTSFSRAQLWIEFEGFEHPVIREVPIRSFEEIPENTVHVSLAAARVETERRLAREAAEAAAREKEKVRLQKNWERMILQKRERMGG